MHPPASRSTASAVCAALLLFVSSLLAQKDARMAAAAATAMPVEHRLAIEGLTEPISNLRVTDLAGRDITSEVKLKTEGTRLTATFNRLDQVVVKPKAIATLSAATRGKQILPGGIIVPLVAAPDGSTPGKTAWFRLTFEASPMPAPWDERSDGYVTRLTFGLRRPPQIPDTIGLQQPVVVKLAYEGMTAGEIPPLTIEAPGLENEKTVELRFQPRTANPKLFVRSTISDVDFVLSALSRLEVRPQQKTILGFGLETVAVVIENVFPSGELHAVDRATPIAIEIDGGARLVPGEAAFAAGASNATVRVRSAGLGPATVTATASGLTGEAVIEQRFPTGLLISALIGSALGGAARRFVKGSRRNRDGRRIVEGLIVGLVAFVAGVLGVGYLELPPAVVATEAGAFLVGALAAFGGVSVLEVLAKKRSSSES